jgi:hypothetical protein
VGGVRDCGVPTVKRGKLCRLFCGYSSGGSIEWVLQVKVGSDSQSRIAGRFDSWSVI